MLTTQKDSSPNRWILPSSSSYEEVALNAYARARYYIYARVPYPDRHDVLMEAFIGIWEGLNEGRFQGNSSFLTYTYVIARRKVIDWMRRKQKERERYVGLPDYEFVHHDYSHLDYETKQLTRQFWDCLDIIENEKAQIAIQLYYKKGMTYKQIAAELDVSMRTVTVYVHTSLRKMIKEMFKRREERKRERVEQR